MTTFSQFVDDMAFELRRPGMQTEIAAYTNQTIRELHARPSNGGMINYPANLKEAILRPQVETGYVWEFPNASRFQTPAGARYDSVAGEDGPTWATYITGPARIMNTAECWYYRVQDALVFAGYGGIDAFIALSWYEYCPRLRYFAAGQRPAAVAADDSWVYTPPNDATPESQAAARALCSHWMLLRWSDIIAEGVRAKSYKKLSDTERARTSYSMYQSLREQLFTSETMDGTSRW